MDQGARAQRASSSFPDSFSPLMVVTGSMTSSSPAAAERPLARWGRCSFSLIPWSKEIGKKARLGKSTTPKSMALCFRAENFMFGRQSRVKWAGEG